MDDISIGNEEVALIGNQRVHGKRVLLRIVVTDYVFVNFEVVAETSHHTGHHAVRMAKAHHARTNQRVVRHHAAARHFFGHAFAFLQIVIGFPRFFVIRIVHQIHQIEVFAGLNGQSLRLQPLFNDFFAADQNRISQFLRHNLLCGMQHAFVFAFRQHNAFDVFFRLRKHGAHQQVGFVNLLIQAFDIGIHIGDGARCHAGIHGSLRHSGGDFGNQARVEWFGNQIFRAEFQFFAAVCTGNDIVRFRQCQIGNRAHGSQLHGFVDGGRAHIQRAAENEREAQNVIDLVWEVGTAGADNHIGARGFGFRRPDFGLRIGQCEHQRLAVHLLQHIHFQHVGARQSQENVFTGHSICQRALPVVFNRVTHFAFVHARAVFACLVNHAFGIAHGHIGAFHAQRHQQIQAGNRRGTRAGAHQFHFADFFAD